MAVPRGSSTGRAMRGSRVRGVPVAAPRTRGGVDTEPVEDPARPRAVVDYALARRATLAGRHDPLASADEGAFDADPYLRKASRHHGETTERPCPLCREVLVDVTYVFGESLGEDSGSASLGGSLADLARVHAEFGVYVVEVCVACGWNHLHLGYTLGHGRSRGRVRRQ